MLILALLLLIPPNTVIAKPLSVKGTPESLEFAKGVRVDVNGSHVTEALSIAKQMKMDWISVDFDWNSTINNTNFEWNELSPFVFAMNEANKLGLNTMISVKNAPAWATTENGPSAELTARVVELLRSRYKNILAVELYPKANTKDGWGSNPNPSFYAKMINFVQQSIKPQETFYVIVGGLSNIISDGDMQDVDFLRELYKNGLKPSIISLQLSALTENILESPMNNSVRHYEEMRKIMVDFGNSSGLLWITNFSAPSILLTTEEQSKWLIQATSVISSQLFIGTIFYGNYNNGSDNVSLIRSDLTLHPFLQALSISMGLQAITMMNSNNRLKYQERISNSILRNK